jgi:hypothetical protein
MAIAVVDPAVNRLIKALGLENCRSAVVTMAHDDVVRVRAEQFATADQLKSLAAEVESKDFVIVLRSEWDRLKANEAFQ